MSFLRKYGTATTIYFPLIKAGSNNFAVSGDYTHAAGDTKISKDGAAAGNTNSAPTAVTMGNGAMWKLDLTATEMEAKTILITIIDATTKAVEDQMIVIETFGYGNGELNLQDIADAVLRRGVATIEASADAYSLTDLILASIIGEFSAAGATLTVKRTDGSTTHRTKTLTTSATGDIVTGVS